MIVSTKSYLKVAYDLRPAKQVERRMILDALGRLMNAGFPIRDYRYTGLGSIYFFDFVLLYKLLGLRKFLNVEHDVDITKRVEFNKPFDLIETRMDPIGDVIPDLSRDEQHVLWLDYDDRLKSSILEDAAAAAYQLSVGSLLLITVDAEPPADELADRLNYFKQEARDLLPLEFTIESCRNSELEELNLAVLANAVKSGLVSRGVSFLPLFKFAYADGHRMVTLGGILGGAPERRRVASADWSGASYIRRRLTRAAYRILAPRLTRRERLHLDRHMPGAPGWLPSEFELDKSVVEAYREIHRFYPLYGELLA